jgi:hypothetical protein
VIFFGFISRSAAAVAGRVEAAPSGKVSVALF